MIEFRWQRYGGYECSSKGDKRFSALYAKLGDRTIEEIYQCDVKGFNPGGINWRDYKGQKPFGASYKDLLECYVDLWRNWASINKDLIEELEELAIKHDYLLSDRFATGMINQANALSIILNEKKAHELMFGKN